MTDKPTGVGVVVIWDGKIEPPRISTTYKEHIIKQVIQQAAQQYTHDCWDDDVQFNYHDLTEACANAAVCADFRLGVFQDVELPKVMKELQNPDADIDNIRILPMEGNQPPTTTGE